jgi:hypothetical protein
VKIDERACSDFCSSRYAVPVLREEATTLPVAIWFIVPLVCDPPWTFIRGDDSSLAPFRVHDAFAAIAASVHATVVDSRDNLKVVIGPDTLNTLQV